MKTLLFTAIGILIGINILALKIRKSGEKIYHIPFFRWLWQATKRLAQRRNSTIVNDPRKTITPSPKKFEIPLICPAGNLTPTCPPANLLPISQTNADRSSPICPEYFRWIHEDLRLWKATGISREIVESAKEKASFRLVVLNGRAYMEKYRDSFQTRDVFTLWGIAQLLRRYSSRLPDLDLMFNCDDTPVVKSRDYNTTTPPPVFRYCADNESLDIVFPDWSFWGWPEVNIKPWESLLKDLKEGNKRIKWMEREPYAYWKGNPWVSGPRMELLKCNVSDTQDWKVHIYVQDWKREARQGFKHSDLASQCNYRYKIYVEGYTWSVSQKYIMACDSLSLLVNSRYYDFFTRSLMPMHHYWPVREDDKCRSIKFAVEWGNSHKQKAQAIGKMGSNFIQEEVKMDNVYDYMFNLLNEYAKLLTYKPVKPRKSIELCSESMVCPAKGLEKKFMMESMVKTSADSSPCTLPPPFDPPTLQTFLKRKANSIKQVEIWKGKAR
ncbi:uncharacterized protein LOC143880652 [Tasmannia lanceolata]|uniref:uncharacterized protein LOC143880652 n=1 Tax=Tasmannia lanceolata TaxID=3420 RepID=UPI004064852D